MKPVIVRYRTYTWAGLLLFAFCTGMGLRNYHASPNGAWYRFIILGIFMGLLFAAIGTRRVIFSESGIESKILWGSSSNTWAQVIQAGVTKIADHGNYGLHLLLTFTGGTPKTHTMGFSDWVNRNGGTCLYVPISEQLCELVAECYGPLDFDQSK